VSHPALIDTVRRSTAQAIAAVWVEARAEAAQCRDSAQHAVDAKRAELDARLAAITKAALRRALAEAERRARAVRAAARSALADHRAKQRPPATRRGLTRPPPRARR
jgi:hypothetical protein